jgi:hypothetical protein
VHRAAGARRLDHAHGDCKIARRLHVSARLSQTVSVCLWTQVTENLNAGKSYFAAEGLLSRINSGALPEYAYAFKVDVGAACYMVLAVSCSHSMTSVLCVCAG